MPADIPSLSVPRTVWPLWLLAAGALFVPLLFIPRAWLLGNSDALFYGNILAMMTDSVRSGDFFPRWFGQANAGFGSPVMLFYAPLPYLITALINLPLAPLLPDIDTQMLIGMYVSQVACGYTSFLWLRRSFPARAALIGSLLFVLLPYKFVYIYLHINLAQLWALALLPLWMMAAEDIISGSRPRAIGAYALVLAGVYYMHPLTLIAFAAAPAAYALWFGRAKLGTIALRLALAHGLGIGICMMQLLPGHYALPWIHAERFLEGNYNWQHNLYHIDVMLCAYYGMIALVVGFAIWGIIALAESAPGRQGLFWAIVLCAVLFLTQRPSAFVYEWLTPLQYLQFPAARLHATALMAVTYLICFWLAYYKEMAPLGNILPSRWLLALMIAVFSVGTFFYLCRLYSDPDFHSDTYIGDAQAADIVSTPVPLYETQWGCTTPKRVYNLYEHKQVPPEVAFTRGSGTIASLAWNPPARIAFTANVQSDGARLVLRQCFFPLWQAQLDGQPLALSPATTDGLIGLDLPHGSHRVEVSFTSPPGSVAGGWISLLCLACSLLLVARSGKRGKISPSAP